MNAFFKHYFSEIISFAVMLLMLVAIVHGQVLVRTTATADVSTPGFESAAVDRGLDR